MARIRCGRVSLATARCGPLLPACWRGAGQNGFIQAVKLILGKAGIGREGIGLRMVSDSLNSFVQRERHNTFLMCYNIG